MEKLHPTRTNGAVVTNRMAGLWRLRALLWLAAILIGLVQTWSLRHHISPDGMSYLDLGDALWRDGWWKTANAYWSPLYAWFIGLAFLVLKPSPFLEFTLAHLMGFVFYLFAALCFDFLLRQLMALHRLRSSDDGVTLPEWAWLTLGWALFLWSSTNLIIVSFISPDMLAAALVYLASGMVLRICLGKDRWLNFVLLGAVLGLAFLTRAPMLPLTFVFLGVLLISIGNLRRSLPRVAAALFVFLLIASVQIAALSAAKGRITFSDSGKLNYLWYMNGITLFVHWQGDQRNGIPVHPTRKIHEAPDVYEFATPIGGTYPPWYDSSYWNEGARTRINLKAHLRQLRTSAEVWWEIIFNLGRGLVLILLILVILSWRGWGTIRDWMAYRMLAVPAVAAVLLYTSLNLEPRYVGPYVPLLCLSVLAVIRLPRSDLSPKVITAVTSIMLIVLAMTVMSGLARDLRRGRGQAGHIHWQVADELFRMGIRPGDKVASIGDAFRAYWARLAKVRIAAEIPSKGPLNEITAGDTDRFWSASDEVKLQVMSSFAKTGARSVTFGWGVPIEATYGRKLESLLSAEFGRRVITINSGVCGYTTSQEYTFLKKNGGLLDPDIVLLLYVINDIVPNDPPYDPWARRSLSGKSPHRAMTILLERSWVYRLCYFVVDYSDQEAPYPLDRNSRGFRESMDALGGL